MSLSSSHQRGRGGRGRSSHHGGRGGRGGRHYTQETMEKEYEDLTTFQTQLRKSHLTSFRADEIKRTRVPQRLA